MTRLQKLPEPLSMANPDSCLQVEFFGLPGSGKTTIARKVYETLLRTSPSLIFAPELLNDNAGIVPRASSKLRLILSELGRESACRDAIGQAMAIRQSRLRDKLRAVFSVATVASLYSSVRRRSTSVVLDQGVLQALWSAQLRAKGGSGGALMAGLLKEAVCSGRIHISVEAAPEVCAARLASRASKHSRMQTADASYDHRAWETAELLRRTLLGSLRAAYRKQGIPPSIIVVDGTLDPTETAAQIVAGLQRTNPIPVLIPSEQLREVGS